MLRVSAGSFQNTSGEPYHWWSFVFVQADNPSVCAVKLGNHFGRLKTSFDAEWNYSWQLVIWRGLWIIIHILIHRLCPLNSLLTLVSLAFIYPFIVLVRRAACTKTTSRSATARRLARSSTSWAAVHFHICHIGFWLVRFKSSDGKCPIVAHQLIQLLNSLEKLLKVGG